MHYDSASVLNAKGAKNINGRNNLQEVAHWREIPPATLPIL